MAARYFVILLLFFLKHRDSSCSEKNVPATGHLLPLGSHTSPSEVEERFDVPSAKEFMERYVFPSKPVVFRSILKNSPMLEKWTDEYISKTYPELEVRMEAKTEKEGYVPIGNIGMGRDSLKNFIDTYHVTNKYLVSELPTPTWHEVVVPSFMTCGPVLKNFVEIDLWMSGGNTSSLLHKDAFNALNCLFNGTKEWKLFSYKHEKDLYKAYEPGSPLGGFSRINPDAVDMIKYPKVATVPWSFTTVNKGDCLFLPKSMYHQVKSYGTMNTAVAMLFSRFDHIQQNKTRFTDCPSKSLPLRDIDVDLQFSGKGMMSMGYSELRNVRKQLMANVDDNDKSTYKHILEAVTIKDGHPLSPKERAEGLMSILKKDGKSAKRITRKLVKALPRSAIREASFLIEPFLPSNSYDYEYFQISPREIAELLSILVKKGNGVVKRDDFLKQYQERLWGSEKFGDSFFDDLAGKGSTSVGKEGIIANFYSAAKKFDRKEGGQSDPDDDDNRDEDDGDNEEGNYDDAYIGRNIDLDSEKDDETLMGLGKQIFEKDFVDNEFSYGTSINTQKDAQESSVVPDSEEESKHLMHDRDGQKQHSANEPQGLHKDEL